MTTGSRVVLVYDERRDEWRQFQVPTSDTEFRTRCGNSLHQMMATDKQCACKKFKRRQEVAD